MACFDDGLGAFAGIQLGPIQAPAPGASTDDEATLAHRLIQALDDSCRAQDIEGARITLEQLPLSGSTVEDIEYEYVAVRQGRALVLRRLQMVSTPE